MKPLFLSLLFAAAAFGQNNISGQGLMVWQSSPAGVACTSSSVLILYQSQIYSCQANVYAAYVSGSSMVYPGAGIANSTGSAWGTSLNTPFGVTNGGTGLTALTLGDLWYGSAANTASRLTGYTTANTAVLTQAGTGSVSAAPAWTNAPAISAANMTSFPTLNQNTTGSAGSVPWSAISAPVNNLTLAMIQFGTTFNYTGTCCSFFQWASTQAASSGTNFSSPSLILKGQDWSGSTPSNHTTTWSMQGVAANGANPVPTLTFTATTSSTSAPVVSMPALTLTAGPLTIAGNTVTEALVANAQLTAQVANVAQTTIATPAANGFYEICEEAGVSIAATTSSTLPNIQVYWTDATDSQLKTFNVAGTNSNNTTTTATTGCVLIDAKAATNIQYASANYASSGATAMQYFLNVRLFSK